MSLIPWRQFFDLERFFENDDWFIPVFPHMKLGKPAMDLRETDKEVIADIELPGFDTKNIEVLVEDDILRVSGKIDEKKEEKEKGYWRKEIRRESFERVVRLPTAVKEDAIEAIYEKGILKITMPKAEAKPSSKVKIRVKEQ